MAKFKPAPVPAKGNTISRAGRGEHAVPPSRQSRNPAGLPDGILQAYGDHPPGSSKPRPRPSSASLPKNPKAKAPKAAEGGY